MVSWLEVGARLSEWPIGGGTTGGGIVSSVGGGTPPDW